MNPAEKLPGWVYAVSPLVLIALIVAGGLWMKSAETKARARERVSNDPDANV